MKQLVRCININIRLAIVIDFIPYTTQAAVLKHPCPSVFPAPPGASVVYITPLICVIRYNLQLLRFDLADYPGAGFTAMEGDFVAVYDKKLIWRAQLYVDEGKNTDGTASGIEDWNDVFPWSNGNAWDTGETGGQIDLEPWTVPHDPDSEYFRDYLDEDDNPILKVCNAVPYSWGGMDSPDDMNLDLSDQEKSLNISRAGGWTDTYAPADDWREYDKESWIGIDGTNYYPYRPVLTSIMYNAGDFYDYNTPYDNGPSTGHTIGVDCTGFVQRAASYTGNRYEIKDVKWDGALVENRLLWDNYDSGVKIAGDDLPDYDAACFYDLSWPVYNATTEIGSREFIYPGSIITMKNHLALVYKVGYQNNDTRIAGIDAAFLNRVYVIEATSLGDIWQVIINQTLELFRTTDWARDANHNVEVRRLFTNQ